MYRNMDECRKFILVLTSYANADKYIYIYVILFIFNRIEEYLYVQFKREVDENSK